MPLWGMTVPTAGNMTPRVTTGECGTHAQVTNDKSTTHSWVMSSDCTSDNSYDYVFAYAHLHICGRIWSILIP